jgi:hypothetical protein
MRSPAKSPAATPVRAAAANRPWVFRKESVYVIYVVTGGAFEFGFWPCCYYAPQLVNKGVRKPTAMPLASVNSGAMVKDIWRSSISAMAVGAGVGVGIARAVEAMKARIIDAKCIWAGRLSSGE